MSEYFTTLRKSILAHLRGPAHLVAVQAGDGVGLVRLGQAVLDVTLDTNPELDQKVVASDETPRFVIKDRKVTF
jgi:hypothetical protein